MVLSFMKVSFGTERVLKILKSILPRYSEVLRGLPISKIIWIPSLRVYSHELSAGHGVKRWAYWTPRGGPIDFRGASCGARSEKRGGGAKLDPRGSRVMRLEKHRLPASFGTMMRYTLYGE